MNQYLKIQVTVMFMLLTIGYACRPSGKEQVVRAEQRVLLIKGAEKDSLPPWDPVVDQALGQTDIALLVSEDLTYLTEDSLKNISAVVLWGIEEDNLSIVQRNALEPGTNAA